MESRTGHWTCVGTVKPELYSQSLKSMCYLNEWRMNRLKAEIDTMPHPKSAMEKREEDTNIPHPAWNRKNVMFTSAESVKNLGDNRTVGSDTESVMSSKAQPTSFCYLCSTMEEHMNHQAKNKVIPKKPSKARIVFIAPPPNVRKKKKPQASVSSADALYKVEVFTGDKPNASTDANVFITINGSEDVLPKTKLHKNTGCSKFVFNSGSREKFYIKGPKLGNLETLTIEHDGYEEKHSWYLEKVEVTDMVTKDCWEFLCNKWLSLHIKDFKIKRHLKSSPKEVLKSEYKIIIHTGKKAFAGTDANVFITLYGEERSSPKILLKDPTQKCFEKGCIDNFQVRLNELGKLKKIRIEHDGKGLAPGWFLDHVVIYKPSAPTQKYYCYCNAWLSRDEAGGRLWKELPCRNKPRSLGGNNGNKIKYEIKVKTGDVKYGGTDADVFIQLIGPEGVTNEIPLDDAKNNFERNMLDVFMVQGDNVGSLEKILIGHDNSGVGAGWFLDKVVIRRFVPPKRAEERSSRPTTARRRNRSKERDVRSYTDQKKDFKELEDSDSLGIMERQILCELKAEADLIRREKWTEREERRDSEGESTDWSDESDGDDTHTRQRRSPDRSVRLSADRTNRRKSSAYSKRRQSSTSRRRSRSREDDQSLNEEERSEKGRKQPERTPIYEDYVFLCNQWLSSDEGDRQIVRELVCQDKKVYYH